MFRRLSILPCVKTAPPSGLTALKGCARRSWTDISISQHYSVLRYTITQRSRSWNDLKITSHFTEHIIKDQTRRLCSHTGHNTQINACQSGAYQTERQEPTDLAAGPASNGHPPRLACIAQDSGLALPRLSWTRGRICIFEQGDLESRQSSNGVSFGRL